MQFSADRPICHIMDEAKNWQNFDLRDGSHGTLI